jgi:hypothetical protein
MEKVRITADKVECFLKELKHEIDVLDKGMAQNCIQLIE